MMMIHDAVHIMMTLDIAISYILYLIANYDRSHA